jgi:hypothetical protein
VVRPVAASRRARVCARACDDDRGASAIDAHAAAAAAVGDRPAACAPQPQEKVAQLVVGTPAIERLGVPAYHWRNNILHGTVDNGLSTQFPQSVGMAASWDVVGLHAAARVMADEQRAKHNLKLAETGGDSTMDYGLDLWGPNIKCVQRAHTHAPPRAGVLLRSSLLNRSKTRVALARPPQHVPGSTVRTPLQKQSVTPRSCF